jgi:hypothetical protein
MADTGRPHPVLPGLPPAPAQPLDAAGPNGAPRHVLLYPFPTR